MFGKSEKCFLGLQVLGLGKEQKLSLRFVPGSRKEKKV